MSLLFSIKSLAILVLLAAFCTIPIIADTVNKKLKFKQDGTFKIVQFTDIHWEDDSDNFQKTTLSSMNSVLDYEKPDLVVLTGDIVLNDTPEESWKEVITPMVERDIPWAYATGNHDVVMWDKEKDMIEFIKNLPLSLTKPGPENLGADGNYILEIESLKSNKPASLVYILNTHRDAQIEGIGGYAWIEADQVNWYREQSKRYTLSNKGTPLPSLMFFHIPLPEYNELWTKGKVIGTKGEAECAPKINTGMFSAILDSRDVMGTFVGHDHINDYIGNLYGIALGYGRKTGLDSYGKMQRGARVFQLKEGIHEFDTWIRLDDGNIIQEVSFPTTFNTQK